MLQKNSHPPGSPDAVEAGCTCPVIDNGYGQGAWVDEQGGACYWITADCPLHDPHKDEEGPDASEPR